MTRLSDLWVKSVGVSSLDVNSVMIPSLTEMTLTYETRVDYIRSLSEGQKDIIGQGTKLFFILLKQSIIKHFQYKPSIGFGGGC